jgi:hypothetical protein
MSNEAIRKKTINGLEIEVVTIVDSDSYESYIEDIVMCFGRDAQGLLLLVVPVILKMSVHIVNIDTSQEAQKYCDMPTFSLIQGPASHQDLKHVIEGNSRLNLHEETLYVMRKDGHYDAIFATGTEEGDESAQNKINARYFKTEFLQD